MILTGMAPINGEAGKFVDTITLVAKNGLLVSSSRRTIDMNDGKSFESSDFSVRVFPLKCTAIAGYLP